MNDDGIGHGPGPAADLERFTQRVREHYGAALRHALRLLRAERLIVVLSNPMDQSTARGPIVPRESDALIVVDVQNSFVPGGSLAVKDGDAIVPLINRLAPAFASVILTQDWHTADHVSFASQHASKQPFERTTLPYGEQVLWPDHCVQSTPGAELVRGLHVPHARLILRKGFHRGIDSYSAFLEADRKTATGLDGYLRSAGIQRVFLCGLATDYCVAWSALDARQLGFEAAVIEDACRAIDLDGSLARAWSEMTKAGVARLTSRDITIER